MVLETGKMSFSERAKKVLDSQPKTREELTRMKQGEPTEGKESDTRPTVIQLPKWRKEETKDLIGGVLSALSKGPESTQTLAVLLKVEYNPTLYHVLVALRMSDYIKKRTGTSNAKCERCGQKLKGHYYEITERGRWYWTKTKP